MTSGPLVGGGVTVYEHGHIKGFVLIDFLRESMQPTTTLVKIVSDICHIVTFEKFRLVQSHKTAHRAGPSFKFSLDLVPDIILFSV